MKRKTLTPSIADKEIVTILRTAQGFAPAEFLEILYGVAADMVAEGVPSAEIEVACAPAIGLGPRRPVGPGDERHH